jgi:hypothetical protein
MGINVFAPYHDENLMQVHKVKGWYMKSFPLPHGDCPNAGCYIMSPEGHSLIYATDFQHIAYRFKGLKINTMLIACNHMDVVDEELNQGKFAHTVRDHSSLSVVKEFIKVNQTEYLHNVILCHLSPENADPVIMKDEIQKVVGDKVKVYVARKGMSVEL